MRDIRSMRCAFGQESCTGISSGRISCDVRGDGQQASYRRCRQEAPDNDGSGGFFENRFSAATAETVREAAPIRKADIPVRKGPDDMGERVKFHENTQVTFTEEEKKLIDEILKEYLG